MELRKGAEAILHDGLAVAKFIGERLVGGAWANVVPHEEQPANIQVHEGNINKGEQQ